MAFSKASLFNLQDQIVSRYGLAMGHPARLEIIRRLCNMAPLKVKELSKGQPLARPTMSEHLEILREAGLITYKEKFPYTYYYPIKKNIRKAEILINEFFKSLGKMDS
jgi:ArsR family transcriptional regulator